MSELTDLLAEELGGEWVDTEWGATCGDGVYIVRVWGGYRAERSAVSVVSDSPDLAMFDLYREEERRGTE